MKIIAEVGSNWYRPDDDSQNTHLLNSINAAALSGANIFKLQLFRAASLYSRERMPEVYDRIQRYEFDLNQLQTCRSLVNARGMQLWASVFDANILYKASEFLQGIKIASGDITNYPLLQAASKVSTRRSIPMAISTGAATFEEIQIALTEIYGVGNPPALILFHCVSSYPADPISLNLLSGLLFRDDVDVIGFSDHTMTSEAAKLAVAMGYTYFEKHFHAWETPENSPDRVVSVSPEEFRNYVDDLKRAKQIIGYATKRVSPSEVKERNFARRGADGLRPKV